MASATSGCWLRQCRRRSTRTATRHRRWRACDQSESGFSAADESAGPQSPSSSPASRRTTPIRCSTSRNSATVTTTRRAAPTALPGHRRCSGNLGPGDPPAKEYPRRKSVYGSDRVGASDASKHLASFSNSGSWVSVAAPGDVSPAPCRPVRRRYRLRHLERRSMAAPLVAGTAAPPSPNSRRATWSARLSAQRRR